MTRWLIRKYGEHWNVSELVTVHTRSANASEYDPGRTEHWPKYVGSFHDWESAMKVTQTCRSKLSGHSCVRLCGHEGAHTDGRGEIWSYGDDVS